MAGSPWTRKIPLNKKWQPYSVFLPGKFHGSLAGYSLWGPQRIRHDCVTKQPQHRDNDINQTHGINTLEFSLR